MKQGIVLAALVLTGLLGACASGGSTPTPIFRRDIGTASAPDALTIGLRVVQQYSYEVSSLDTIAEIRMLTHWKPRRVFEDEAVLGVTAAESRLMLLGRPRGQTRVGAFYTLNLTVENRVQTAGSGTWNETLNTAMFEHYANEITQEYRRQITDIGVRRF